VSFSERRKILKEANYLELRPIPLCANTINEENLVTLLVPKFRKKFFVKYFSPLLKSSDIKINLDLLGSTVWTLMNGKNTVGDISKLLSEKAGDEQNLMEERLTKFLTQLYIQRLITFEEIKGV